MTEGNNYWLIGRMFPSSGAVSITAPWFSNISLEQVQGRVSRGLDLVIQESSDLIAPHSRPTNALVVDQALEKEFERLVANWKRETRAQSSLGEIFTNDSYQRILGMGKDALPMILADLQKAPGHWFYALEKIVGHDVASGAKTFGEARDNWLQWGYKQNLI